MFQNRAFPNATGMFLLLAVTVVPAIPQSQPSEPLERAGTQRLRQRSYETSATPAPKPQSPGRPAPTAPSAWYAPTYDYFQFQPPDFRSRALGLLEDSRTAVDYAFADALWNLGVDLIADSFVSFSETADALARWNGMQLLRRGYIPSAGRFADYSRLSVHGLGIDLRHRSVAFGDLSTITSRTIDSDRGFFRFSRVGARRYGHLRLPPGAGVVAARRVVPVMRPGRAVGWVRSGVTPVRGRFPTQAVVQFAAPVRLSTPGPGQLRVSQRSKYAVWTPSQRALRTGRLGSNLFRGAFAGLSGTLEVLQAAATFKDQVDQFAFWTQVISPNPYLTNNETNDVVRFVHLKAGPLEILNTRSGLARDSGRSFYDFQAVGHGRYRTAAGRFSYASRVRAHGPGFGPGTVLLNDRIMHRHRFGFTDTRRIQRLRTTSIIESYAHVFFPARTYDPSDSVRTTVRKVESYREVRNQQGVVRTPVSSVTDEQVAPVRTAEPPYAGGGPVQPPDRGGVMIDIAISEEDFR